jgi:hypothetical protein
VLEIQAVPAARSTAAAVVGVVATLERAVLPDDRSTATRGALADLRVPSRQVGVERVVQRRRVRLSQLRACRLGVPGRGVAREVPIHLRPQSAVDVDGDAAGVGATRVCARFTVVLAVHRRAGALVWGRGRKRNLKHAKPLDTHSENVMSEVFGC